MSNLADKNYEMFSFLSQYYSKNLQVATIMHDSEITNLLQELG